jgi:hypothetical protein
MRNRQGELMTVTEVLAKLEALGSEKVRSLNIRNGADEQQYGVKLGDIRSVAKATKADHGLAMQL